MEMHVLLLTNTKSVFPTEGFRLGVYFLAFTKQCMRLVVFQVLLCSLKGRWYRRLTHKRTFLRWFREVYDCPLLELPLVSVCNVCRCGKLYMRKIYILIVITVQHMEPRDPAPTYGFVPLDNSTSPTVKHHLFTDEASFTRDSINNS